MPRAMLWWQSSESSAAVRSVSRLRSWGEGWLSVSRGPDAGFMGERPGWVFPMDQMWASWERDLGEYFPWTRWGLHGRETWVSISRGPDVGFMGERPGYFPWTRCGLHGRERPGWVFPVDHMWISQEGELAEYFPWSKCGPHRGETWVSFSRRPGVDLLGERPGEYFPWTRCEPHGRESWLSISCGPDVDLTGETWVSISQGPDMDLTGERPRWVFPVDQMWTSQERSGKGFSLDLSNSALCRSKAVSAGRVWRILLTSCY